VTRTQTAFQAAASGYHREIGEALAQAGANVDFHAAAFLDRVALIEDRKGENVDEIDGFGLTALHRAIQGGAEGSVRRLLEMGASVEVSSDTYTFGGKAIHVAATTDATPKMIDMLIQAGADVNQDMNPGTPLRVAERSGRGKTAEVLRGMGAVE